MSFTCQLGVSIRNYTPGVISTPGAQILVSNLILHSKKPQLPEKKAESRTGAGNIYKVSPECLIISQEVGKYKTHTHTHTHTHHTHTHTHTLKNQLKEFQWPKIEQLEK